MFSRVLVRKGALDYFRKLARAASPLEIQAYLAGKVNSINEVEITDFLYTKKYAVQTTNEVAWFAEDLASIKEQVELQDKRIIGEIHSHPEYEIVMSSQDYESSVTQQFIICGIVSIRKKRTSVRFWTPSSALPCKIIYK